MKKIVSMLLVVAMMLCGVAFAEAGVAKEDLKIGFIAIGDENEGYTGNFLNGVDEMLNTLGLSKDNLIVKTNIGENELCYDAAIDLAEAGCQIIIANSFGHEPYIMQAAIEYPEIEFCHATGVSAAASGLPNLHNFFGAIYEARYVAGIVAGMKLNEMIENGTITAEEAVIGYVGAFPFAEVVSGYTSFFLGARSVCPSVTMNVKYTNSWGDFSLEKEAAEALIAQGCKLISQHADTTGAPTACEAANVPCVGYNISMIATAQNNALISSAINWAPFMTMAVESVLNGESFAADWCGSYADGGVRTTEINELACAAGTAEAVAAAEAALKEGTLKVFDTATFTVPASTNGTYTIDEAGHVLTCIALDTNGDYVADFGEAIVDGAFAESALRSAPYFELRIDGITELA